MKKISVTLSVENISELVFNLLIFSTLNIILFRLFTLKNTLNLYRTHVKYNYLGIDTIKGYPAHHIEIKHYARKRINAMNSHIFIDKETKSILAYWAAAQENVPTKKLFDFKSNLFLSLLGIKINVKKYYFKTLFDKNNMGIWTPSSYMLYIPASVKQKKLLNGYVSINARLENKIVRKEIPKKSSKEIYEDNKKLFKEYCGGKRFADKLNYKIPLTQTQKANLEKCNTP